MDKNYFINGGIPPPSPQFETSMPFPWSGGLNEQSFFNPTSSIDQFSNFESTWMSTAAVAASNDTFALRELIGKLGNSTAFPPPAAATAVAASPKRGTPILDPLPCLSADPGFAERAAKFSCFGSRSFNGRTGPVQFGEPGRRSGTPLIRVSSTPTLKRDGSPLDNEMEEIRAVNSNEESSVSEQIPSGETASKTSNELNSRKRKGVSRGKTSNSCKGGDGDENGNVKRSKAAAESNKNETKTEEETNDESDKQKTNQKPPEPPKDYIHVRARRGQATDSHSLAERVRREKISERMKLLQDLVPGCNKVTGKALMLDEIINYVQSLQRQVEFLSMKLSSVNPDLDFNSENLLSKDMFQPTTLPQQQMYPLDSAGPAFYQSGNNPVDPHPFDAPSCRNLGIDGFNHQFPTFTQDDLNSIVQMGFVQNPPHTFPVQNQASNMKVEL